MTKNPVSQIIKVLMLYWWNVARTIAIHNIQNDVWNMVKIQQVVRKQH